MILDQGGIKMSYELTNEEKAGIVEQHIKNLQYSKFNLEISLIEESASASPKQSLLDDLNKQINEVANKISKLLEELEKIS